MKKESTVIIELPEVHYCAIMMALEYYRKKNRTEGNGEKVNLAHNAIEFINSNGKYFEAE